MLLVVETFQCYEVNYHSVTIMGTFMTKTNLVNIENVADEKQAKKFFVWLR